MPGKSRIGIIPGALVTLLLTFVFAIACSSDSEPAPAAAPAIDQAQLSQLVQDAVKAAVPAAPVRSERTGAGFRR